MLSFSEVFWKWGEVKAFLRARILSVDISLFPPVVYYQVVSFRVKFIYHYFSFQRLKIFKAQNSSMESLYEIVSKRFRCKLTLFQSYEDNGQK